MNGIYILWQVITGNFMGAKHGYYGIAIIGEYSSLNSGLILAFLSIFFFLLKRRLVAFIFTLFTVATMSRASIIGLLLTIFIFSTLKDRMFYMTIVAVAVGSFIYTFYDQIEWVIRIVDWKYALDSLLVRIVNDYYPTLERSLGPFSLVGLGKGLWGTLGLPIEAHNYYLRIFSEEGLVGLVIFMLLVFYILRIGVNTFEKKLLKMTFFLLLSSSLFQDAMATQKGLGLLVLSINFYQLSKRKYQMGFMR
jgi:hypothetical protein